MSYIAKELRELACGVRCVVTKPSDDGTFEAGDHITKLEDGSIICREGGGWIDACDAAEATKGMKVEVDREWVERHRSKLVAELASILNLG
jgi:carbamate kinase